MREHQPAWMVCNVLEMYFKVTGVGLVLERELIHLKLPFGLSLKYDSEREILKKDRKILKNVEFETYDYNCNKYCFRGFSNIQDVLRKLLLRIYKKGNFEDSSYFICMNHFISGESRMYTNEPFLYIEIVDKILTVKVMGEETFAKNCVGFQKVNVLQYDLGNGCFIYSSDVLLEHFLESVLPKKKSNTEVLERVIKPDLVKQEIEDKIGNLEIKYHLKYKKTGHVNKNVELSIINEIIIGLQTIEKEIGMINYPKVKKLILNMSKTSWGMYDEAESAIEISKFIDLKEVRKTLYHEYGHHIYAYYFKKGKLSRGIISDLSVYIRKGKSLEFIKENALERKENYDKKTSFVKQHYNVNRYISAHEKYLLKSTEIFARLIECMLSGVYKETDEDEWNFYQEEVEVFEQYFEKLKGDYFNGELKRDCI